MVERQDGEIYKEAAKAPEWRGSSSSSSSQDMIKRGISLQLSLGKRACCASSAIFFRAELEEAAAEAEEHERTHRLKGREATLAVRLNILHGPPAPLTNCQANKL